MRCAYENIFFLYKGDGIVGFRQNSLMRFRDDDDAHGLEILEALLPSSGHAAHKKGIDMEQKMQGLHH